MSLLLLAAVLALSIFLVVLGLPGLWIMLGAALVYDWLVPASSIGMATLAVVTALAVAGEVLEFILATRYTAKYGGSTRAGWGPLPAGSPGRWWGSPSPSSGA